MSEESIKQAASLFSSFKALDIDRRNFLRSLAVLGFSSATAGALMELAAPAVAADGSTRRLRYAVTDPRDPSVDPGSILGSTSVTLGFCVFEGLIGFDPATADANGVVQNPLVNQLVTSFESSADGLRHKFRLKEGVQFHGGYGELTAEDIKYSFERIAGKTGEKLAFQSDWAALDRVDVVDKYTGEIVLKSPYAPLMGTTIPWFVGWVASKKALEERGSEFATRPIGTGPYEWAEFAPQQRVLLKRFKDWHGGADAVDWDEIEIVWIRDANAQAIALEAGDVDATRLAVNKVSQFEKLSGFHVASAVTLDQIWIGLNLLKPVFKDERVRQAIRYAVDVPAIITGVYEDRYTQATGPVAPSMPIGYWKDGPKYKRDAAKARQLLAEAGASDLKISIAVPRDSELRLAAEIVQANLGEVGIQVDVDVRSDLVSLGPKARELDLFIGSFTAVPPDPTWATQWWRCDGFDQYNWMYWCDAEYDRLDVAATLEADPAKRSEMYVEAQKRWDQAVHSIWVAWPSVFIGAREQIEVSWVNSAPNLPRFRWRD